MREGLVIFLAISAVIAENAPESKVVKISQGLVKGYKSSEGDVFAFYGIPYATEPQGPLKFQPPLPGPVWQDTLEAVDRNIICPQHKMFTVNKTIGENCLVANVFVPNTEKTNLPVLAYVHGGAYQIGSGEFMTPISLMDEKKFIVVTFNYRLGIHGFLCLGTDDVPGNAGMKDMVALLRWVKKNIGDFGGNPNDVTIDGFSAGSSAVELLMLSETTKGLFNKVIPQSGAAVGVWSVQMEPVEMAKEFAKRFKIDTDDVYALEEFYKSKPLAELNIDAFQDRIDSTFAFVPCVERKIGSERFLEDAPVNIIKSDRFRNVPTLVGFSDLEGLFRLEAFEIWKDRMNKKFSDFLPADLKFESEAEKEEVAKTIKEFYFKDKPVNDESIQGFIDYFSDITFAYPTMRSVKLQVEAGSDSVYLYEYSYVDERKINGFAHKFPKLRGAGHCEQTSALLDSPIMTQMFGLPEPSEEFNKVRAMMRKIWTNFVLTGRPVPEGSTELPAWPATSADGTPYMSLNLKPELKGTLLPERNKFWDGIYAKYYRMPQPPPTPKKHTEL